MRDRRRALRDAVLARYEQLGGTGSTLGRPTTGTTAISGGTFAHFERGSIYWSSATGARVVSGAVRDRWAALGWEHGLGYPTTDTTPISGGTYSHFQRGSIYWSPATGAHQVGGAIRDRWAATGWERGYLGYPTSDERAVPGGRANSFQGGEVRWTSATGAVDLPTFRTSARSVTAAELGASWRSGCPVAPADLREVAVTYVGYDGRAHEGRIVMHRNYVGVTQRVFARLYAERFPIQRMEPVSRYGGDDEASMRANNTSGFNCRPGRHDDGAAIDINPLVNPYVKGAVVQPATAGPYVDRTQSVVGMVKPGDVVVRAFAAEGWAWGGDWRTLKDYQHFSDDGR